jgi:hypothetical protein
MSERVNYDELVDSAEPYVSLSIALWHIRTKMCFMFMCMRTINDVCKKHEKRTVQF